MEYRKTTENNSIGGLCVMKRRMLDRVPPLPRTPNVMALPWLDRSNVSQSPTYTDIVKPQNRKTRSVGGSGQRKVTIRNQQASGSFSFTSHTFHKQKTMDSATRENVLRVPPSLHPYYPSVSWEGEGGGE